MASSIGYVPQRIHLIDDTIAANIAFGETLRILTLRGLNGHQKYHLFIIL